MDNKKFKPKYIARVKNGKGFRYFYTKDEYQTYLHPEKTVKDIKSKFSKTLSSISSKINKAEKEVSKTISPTIKKVEKEISKDTTKLKSEVSKKVTPVINKAEKEVKKIENDETTKKVEKYANKIADKVKTTYKELVKSASKSGIIKAGKDVAKKSASKTLDYYESKEYSKKVETINNVVNFVLAGAIKLAISNHNKIANIVTGTKVKNVKDLPKQTKKLSDDENESEINPNYNKGTYSYTNNCAYCTAAYDLRRRGYDVEASGKDDTIYNNNGKILAWYKNAKEVKVDTTKPVNDLYNDKTTMYANMAISMNENNSLEKGAYGHMFITWSVGGGHDVFWEYQDGDVIVRDTQSNTKYTLAEYITEYGDYISDLSYFRSDNLELDDSICETVRKKKRSK